MNIQQIHNLFLKCSSISIDTRNIQPNSFFVAIKGDRFDANIFAKEAIGKGASFVMIDNPDFYIDERTILVNNCLFSLQELANFHRNYLKLPIIAITGSNGKTTTKELIQAVLSKKYNTTATVGNLNNHIGVPLTLLSFSSETEIGIVEMGANHKKEIEFLCNIAQPDFGYITNFGKAHLEGFGGVEGVIQGKSEMYDFLLGNEKVIFVNVDDSIQVEKTRKGKIFSFGTKNDNANINITEINANPFVSVRFQNIIINSKLIGLYNANNINVALTIGSYFEVPVVDIKEAIEGYTPENNRSQLINKNSNEIILDAYNANPSSMNVALINFFQLKNASKIVVLGDMFELGEDSFAEHKGVVNMFESEFDCSAFFIGKYFFQNKIAQNNLHFFESFESFIDYFKNLHPENSIILIKGSRGMALERVLEFI
jgi:UDP-N-acetylmuramoyl-tripeptide--D-alanyl-D-alanine ligase